MSEIIRKILLDTIDILNERGWNQHSDSGPNGEVCVGRAIDIAASNLPVVYRLPIYDKVLKAAGCTHNWITNWNDQGGMTVEDVILALKQAAENET